MQKSAHLWRFACWKMFVFGLSGDFFFFHYAQYILQVCAVLSVAITVNLSVSSFHKLYHNCVGRGKQRTTGISAKCAFRHQLGSRNLSPTDTKCSRSLVFLMNLPQVLSYETDSTSKWSVWINSFLSSTLKTLTQSLKINLLMCYYNSLAHCNCGEQANYFQEIIPKSTRSTHGKVREEETQSCCLDRAKWATLIWMLWNVREEENKAKDPNKGIWSLKYI